MTDLTFNSPSKVHETNMPLRGRQERGQSERATEGESSEEDEYMDEEIQEIAQVRRGIPQQQGLGFVQETFGQRHPAVGWFQPQTRLSGRELSDWQYPQQQYCQPGAFGGSLQPQRAWYGPEPELPKNLNEGLDQSQRAIMADMLMAFCSEKDPQERWRILEKIKMVKGEFTDKNRGFRVDTKGRPLSRAFLPPSVVSGLKKQAAEVVRLTPEERATENRRKDFKRMIEQGLLTRNNDARDVDVFELDVDTLITVTAEAFEYKPAHYWERVGWCFDTAKALMRRCDRGERIPPRDFQDLRWACNFGEGEYEELPDVVEAYATAKGNLTKGALDSACARIFTQDINEKRIEKGLQEYNRSPTMESGEIFSRGQSRQSFMSAESRERPPEFSQSLDQGTSRKSQGIDWGSTRFIPRQMVFSDARTREKKGEFSGRTEEKETRKRKDSKVARTEAVKSQSPAEILAKKAKQTTEGRKTDEQIRKEERERLIRGRESMRAESAENFAFQYDNLSQRKGLIVGPLSDRPVVHDGRHWGLTSPNGPVISAEDFARRFNSKLPKELEDVELNKPFELAIFRKILTLVNLKGEARLQPDRGWLDIFTDDDDDRAAKLRRYERILFEQQGNSWLPDRVIMVLMEIWADMDSQADEEWNEDFEYPMMIEKVGKSDSTCLSDVATCSLEDRWEYLLNTTRIRWVKEYVRRNEAIISDDVIAAILKLRFEATATKALFTEKANMWEERALMVIEIFRDEHPSALTDFYLRHLAGPQFRGSIIWINPFMLLKSKLIGDHYRSIVDHMYLSHSKGHWFYYVTQAISKDAVEQHNLLKGQVEVLGIREGVFVDDPDDYEGTYHWFTNLPIGNQQESESPEVIINYLRDKYRRSLEGRGPGLLRKQTTRREERRMSKSHQKDLGTGRQSQDSPGEIMIIDSSESENGDKDNDQSNVPLTRESIKRKSLSERSKQEKRRKTTGRREVYEDEQHGIEYILTDEPQSTSKLFGQESVVFIEKGMMEKAMRKADKERKLAVKSKPESLKPTQADLKLQKLARAEEDKKELAVRTVGLEDLPFLRLAAVTGELRSIRRLKEEIFQDVERAAAWALPGGHRVVKVGSSVHDLGLEGSDLDISITSDEYDFVPYEFEDVLELDKTLLMHFEFYREENDVEEGGLAQWVVTYDKRNVTIDLFRIRLLFGNPNLKIMAKILADYSRNYLVRSLCRIMQSWAYENYLFGTQREEGLSSSIIYILAIKIVIMNSDKVKAYTDEKAVLKGKLTGFQTDLVDPEPKTAVHEEILVQLILKFLWLLANSDWGKTRVEIVGEKLATKRPKEDDALMIVQEPADGTNLAYRITNRGFIDVMKAVADEAYNKLLTDKTPRALNLTNEGEILSEEATDKYVTASGEWIPQKAKEPSRATLVKRAAQKKSKK